MEEKNVVQMSNEQFEKLLETLRPSMLTPCPIGEKDEQRAYVANVLERACVGWHNANNAELCVLKNKIINFLKELL